MDTPHTVTSPIVAEKDNRSLKILVIVAVLLLAAGIITFIFVYFSSLAANSNQTVNSESNSNTEEQQSQNTNAQQQDSEGSTNETTEVPDRLKVTSPTPNDILSTQEFLVEGEMKNFFEAVLNLKLKNDAGDVIYEDVILANGNNYESFAPFSKTVSLPNSVNFDTENIYLEFYDISAMDGSETTLLTITLVNDIAQ